MTRTPHERSSRNETTPHPKARPDRRSSIGIERHVPGLRARDPAAEVAAEQDRAARGLDPGGGRDLGEGRAHLELDDARLRRAADREQGRPPGLAASGFAIPAVTEPCDQRRVGEALDVLHQRRSAVDAALERPRRRRGRPGIALVHEVDRGGLLARDVRARRRDDLDGDPRGALAAHGTPLLDRPVERVDRVPVLGADIQDDAPRPDGVGRQLRAVEHEVRAGGHEHAVLRGERLALGPVDEDDRVAVRRAPRPRPTCAPPGSRPRRARGDRQRRAPG